MNTEIMPHVDVAAPLSVQQAVEQYNAQGEFIRAVLKPGIDYGIIPGTGSKPSLYKPGAEKAINFYRYTLEMKLVDHVEDWTGGQHAGEPFFYYHYAARLLFGGMLVAEAEGSCNSWEDKYRWRKVDRHCPACGATAIKRSKFPPRGNPNGEPGWYCHDKSGGCGAQFAAQEPAIVEQVAGRMPNDRIFDQVNTLKKMAQKRAMVAVALIGCRLSDTFTQDVEDLVYDTTYSVPPEKPAAQPRAQRPAPVESFDVATKDDEGLPW